MTKEEFVENYFKCLEIIIYDPQHDLVKWSKSVIESIWDLQQQINELQEQKQTYFEESA